MSSVIRHPSTVLGIETSCDETAAAIVTADRKILANTVLSQVQEHARFGGVVPEIAARAHIRHLEPIIREALVQAGMQLQDVDALAVTAGPGLIGGVIVGVMMAKGMASALGKPLVAVNHLEGHALTARLTDEVEFPYLLLLASGGHCQFLSVEGVGKYVRLGGTVDDALGEAYDKTAKLLGLGLPGGPKVEALARGGNPRRYPFTVPMYDRKGCDMSFSGLKTAVRTVAEQIGTAAMTEEQRADLCASFQYVAGESVANRLTHAIAMFRERHSEGQTLVMAGGVAANQYLRARLGDVAQQADMQLVVPPAALCTDNAAMIAWAGIERLHVGVPGALDFEPRARWPLSELSAA